MAAQPSAPVAPAASSSAKKVEVEHKPWINGVSGGFGASLAKTMLAPVQRIVVLKQLGDHKGLSTMQLVKVIIAEEKSIKGFWRGNLMSIMQRFPYSGIQLMVYDRCKFAIAEAMTRATGKETMRVDSSKNISLSGHLLGMTSKALAGGLAAAISGSAVFPMEVVRTRIMSGDERYRKIVPTIKSIYGETNSPRNFYRGLGASLIQRVPDILINFAVYESVNFALSAQGYSKPVCITAGGMSAALVAVCFTFPLDVCKRRIAMAGQSKTGIRFTSTWHCLTHVLRCEGAKGLYAGAPMEAVRCMPQVVIMWFAIEGARKFLEENF